MHTLVQDSGELQQGGGGIGRELLDQVDPVGHVHLADLTVLQVNVQCQPVMPQLHHVHHALPHAKRLLHRPGLWLGPPLLGR